MMHFNDFRAFLQQTPFRPLRVTLTDGRTYDVTHPELAMVGRSDVRVAELAQLRSRQTDLVDQKTTIEYRIAREHDDTLSDVFKKQHAMVQSELQTVARDLQRVEAEQASTRSQKPEDQVESALGLLDDVTRITANTHGDPT